jgi:hypothetical protein
MLAKAGEHYRARQHASLFWSHIYRPQHLLQFGLRPLV